MAGSSQVRSVVNHMKHQVIIISLVALIVTAAVGGFVYWEWSEPVPQASTAPRVVTTPENSLLERATTTARQLMPRVGPSAAEAADGVAVASPSIVAVNEPTDVTVTIQVTDSRLIPGSVNLQRLDATGKVIAVLGTLNDTGTGGDAVAGDKTFTIRRTFNETTTTPVRLRISWALSGVLRRGVSNIVSVEVWQQVKDPGRTFSILFPPDWTVTILTEGLALSNPSRSLLLADPEEVETPQNVTLVLVPNPQQLDLESFVAEYEGGYFTNYPSTTPIEVGGRAALLVSEQPGSLVGLSPVQAVFVDIGANVGIITLNDRGANEAQFEAFRRILSTIRF